MKVDKYRDHLQVRRSSELVLPYHGILTNADIDNFIVSETFRTLLLANETT
jgi:hypothetical protein